MFPFLPNGAKLGRKAPHAYESGNDRNGNLAT